MAEYLKNVYCQLALKPPLADILLTGAHGYPALILAQKHLPGDPYNGVVVFIDLYDFKVRSYRAIHIRPLCPSDPARLRDHSTAAVLPIQGVQELQAGGNGCPGDAA